MSSDRLEKVLRMLESNFDGERSNAARVLANMATEAKKTVPEFLAANLKGSGAKPQSAWQQGAAMGGELVRWQALYHTANARANRVEADCRILHTRITSLQGELQRARDEGNRLRAQLAAARAGAPEPQETVTPPWEGESQFDALKGLSDFIDRFYDEVEAARDKDPFLLNDWEVEFCNSIFDKVARDKDLTHRQRHVMDEILRKIKRATAEPLI